MVGYVRQSVADIVTGLVVEAAPLNNELNAILAAMNASTGHNHDGTTGGGAKIHLVNSIDTATKLRLGYGGTNADLSAAPVGSSLTVSSTGSTGALTYIKNNLTATAAPAVTDDSGDGYTYLSQWLDTTAGTLYVLTDPTVGAAVWIASTNLAAIAVALNKFRVSSNDTTPGYATSKIVPSTLLTYSIDNASADEDMVLKSISYTASGTDTYTATPSPAITAYAEGQAFLIEFTNGNTGAATINLNGVGAAALTKRGALALGPGDIPAGHMGLILYDGTNFQLLNSAVSNVTFTAAGTDTYTITAAPVATAYYVGMEFNVLFTNANTGAATLNVNGLGAKSIKKNSTSAIVSGDILAGHIHRVVYDGTNFQIIGAIYIMPTQPTLQLTAGGTQGTGFTAAVNTKYTCVFAANGTITGPASATAGDIIVLALAGNYIYTFNPNGLKMNTSTSNYLFTGNQTVVLEYTGATDGWV